MNIRKVLVTLGFDYKIMSGDYFIGGKIIKTQSTDGKYAAYRGIILNEDESTYRERLDLSCIIDGIDLTVTMWQRGSSFDLVNHGGWTDGDNLVFSKKDAVPSSETEIHAGERWIQITRAGAMKALKATSKEDLLKHISKSMLKNNEEEYGFMDYDV